MWKEVNQETFDKDCKDPNYCTIVDNKYYDKEGKEVDETEYNLQCKPHSCDKVNDNYFDKNGNLVSQEDYNKSCSDHYCTKIGDTYYGKDGQPIDKKQYDVDCAGLVENPKTGVGFISVIGLISLGTIGLSALYFAKKHNRFI